MATAEVTIDVAGGLHAVHAFALVQAASRFKSQIKFTIGNKTAWNGKSVVGILALGGKRGDRLIVAAEGEDEQEAVNAIISLVKSNFNEEE
jgi:phosphocarrier protein HPr